MKDHDPRIAVTEHSLHRGIRPKSLEAVRLMELKPTTPWRHSRSMPVSRDPATPLAPAPTAAGNPFGSSDSPTRFREDPEEETLKEAVFSLWKGQEATSWRPFRLRSIPRSATTAWSGFADLMRSIPSFVTCIKTSLLRKSCQEGKHLKTVTLIVDSRCTIIVHALSSGRSLIETRS